MSNKNEDIFAVGPGRVKPVILLFWSGFIGFCLGAMSLPSVDQCKSIQQRLEQRIIDDKKSLELLKKTEK